MQVISLILYFDLRIPLALTAMQLKNERGCNSYLGQGLNIVNRIKRTMVSMTKSVYLDHNLGLASQVSFSQEEIL